MNVLVAEIYSYVQSRRGVNYLKYVDVVYKCSHDYENIMYVILVVIRIGRYQNMSSSYENLHG